MASLNNYIKGNLLLQKGFHNASFETSLKNLRFCQKLFTYSLQESINAKDRNILIINFDIGKHKRVLYETIGGTEVKYENKKIVQLQSKLYLIEYNFDFEVSDTPTNHKELLEGLLTEFKQEVIQKHPQPLFLFIQGLEILEIYMEQHQVYYWLLKILEEFTSLKQAYFLIQGDMISMKMMQYLETIVNCRVLIEDHEQTEEKIDGAVQMVLSKNSGFSYFENYKVSLKGDQKIFCKIEKITKEMIEAQKNEGKDLQTFFQTSFKIELSEADKLLRAKAELPHMKAQTTENVWKDFLLEAENVEEDPEQDEDEDLDV